MKALSISTLIYFTIFAVLVIQLTHQSTESISHQYNGNDEGRNERSSPRSFILPSTPAVALVQEKKISMREQEFQIKYCMLKLHDLGYTIRGFEDIFDIKIFTALLDYQKMKGLNITGEFESKTISSLGCSL